MKPSLSIRLAVLLFAGAAACGDSSSGPDTGEPSVDSGPAIDSALDGNPTPDTGVELDGGPPPDTGPGDGGSSDGGTDGSTDGGTDGGSSDGGTDGGIFLAPVSYHSLDDTAGTVADQLGGYDLDDISGTIAYGEAGKVASAMSFRSGGLAASTALYAARADVSVSLWFKTDTAAAPGMRQRIWAWGISIPSRFILSMSPDGQLEVYVERSGNGLLNHRLLLATGNLADGNWHHVALRRERVPGPTGFNRVDAFVDGATTPISAQSPNREDFEFHNSQPFALGAAGNPFQGVLDEIAVFDYALSESERQAAWTRGSAGLPLLE